jgi:hypothetical protein
MVRPSRRARRLSLRNRSISSAAYSSWLKAPSRLKAAASQKMNAPAPHLLILLSAFQREPSDRMTRRSDSIRSVLPPARQRPGWISRATSSHKAGLG